MTTSFIILKKNKKQSIRNKTKEKKIISFTKSQVHAGKSILCSFLLFADLMLYSMA